MLNILTVGVPSDHEHCYPPWPPSCHSISDGKDASSTDEGEKVDLMGHLARRVGTVMSRHG